MLIRIIYMYKKTCNATLAKLLTLIWHSTISEVMHDLDRPHLHICWVLSTGSLACREHTGQFMAVLDSKPSSPSWWAGDKGWASTAEQELGFPGAEQRWFHAVPMTCKHGWRPGEDNLSATGLPHSGPLCVQVCFELDALPFSDGWGWALKLSYACFCSLSLLSGEVVNRLVAWLSWDIPIFCNINLLEELNQGKWIPWSTQSSWIIHYSLIHLGVIHKIYLFGL